jgi:membrane-associated phospholipid phosphatase
MRISPSPIAWPVTVFLTALAAFFTLTLWAAVGERPGWDHGLLELALEHRSAALREAMLALAQASAAPGAAIVAACIAAWLLLRRRLADALFFALAVAGAGVLSSAFKALFREARPELTEPLGPASGFAYPSGHAMSTMAILAAALALARWRGPRLAILVIGGLLVASVGASRVVLAAHYPSDVLAGWSASIAWVAGLYAVTVRWPAILTGPLYHHGLGRRLQEKRP